MVVHHWTRHWSYPRIMTLIGLSFLLWLLWNAYSDEQHAIKRQLSIIAGKVDSNNNALIRLESENAKLNAAEITSLGQILDQTRSNENVLKEIQLDLEAQVPPQQQTTNP